MKRGAILLVAIATVLACRKTGLKPNPLGSADPANGFVADAFAKTGGALDAAIAEGLFDRERIAAAEDPLGVARLSEMVEAARVCPSCTQPAGAKQSLAAFVQNTAAYPALVGAHADAIERWASIGIAHAALAIANLEESRLDAAAHADIQGRAASLSTALASPLSTFDWKLLTGQADPLIAAELGAHVPFPLPAPAVVSSADQLTASVVDALDRLFPGLPLPDLCCSSHVEALPLDSAAYQALRRLAIVREWRARVPLDTAPGYVAAITPIAAAAAANGVSDPQWTSYYLGALSHEARLSAGMAALQAGLLIDDPGIGQILPLVPASVDDPNAGGFVANVPNPDPGTPGWASLEPHLTLRASAEISFFAQEPIPPYYTPRLTLPGTPAPSPAPTPDHATQYPPAGPVTIQWTTRAAHPMDHVDLRIHRGATLVAHWVERANGAGQFPSRTVFDPRTMDSTAPAPPAGGHAYVSYRVNALAVDASGHVSDSACTQIDARFGDPPATQDEYSLFLEDGEPLRDNVCDGLHELGEMEVGVTTASFTIYQTTSGFRVFDPFMLYLPPGTTQLSIHNADTIPVQMKSIYTPPYFLEFPPIPLSIGGVAPLDTGTIAPGATVNVPILSTVPAGTRFYLYDLSAGERVRLDRR